MKELRLVLLERDDQARELYTEYLVGEGYRVRAETLFDDAIAALKKGNVPLVIAGIAPGGATVGQIAGAIRRVSPHTVLLALLGREATEGTLRAVRDGALEALAKPVTAEALGLAARRCLETFSLLERQPEMRRHLFVYQVARRLQRVSDPPALAEQLLDACLSATGGEGGVVLRPGEGGAMDVWAARQLDEAGARELASGLDWTALRSSEGVIVPVPAQPPAGAAPPARGKAKSLAQVTLVRVGPPGNEQLWVALLHGTKAAAALASASEAERREQENALALYAQQALFALDMGRRYAEGVEAAIDPVTDLADARGLERAVAHEIQLARKGERQVAVLWLEVAKLAEVKEQHGELASGRALVEASRLLTRSVRDVDLVARIGDTAFGVLLASTDAAGAGKAAERIRAAFERHRFLAREGLELSLSVSVGLAAFPADGEGAKDLLAAAQAGAAGRVNTVTRATAGGRKRAKG